MTVINTSINTALSNEDEKCPIIFTIQTEEIKQYTKNIHTKTEHN